MNWTAALKEVMKKASSSRRAEMWELERELGLALNWNLSMK